ncbi:MAG: REP-associated tyrosine transposase [Gammaproteobacteria bacterium]
MHVDNKSGRNDCFLAKNKPRSSNLRKGRVSEPGRAYMLTTVTYGRQPIFTDLYCGRELANAISYHDRTGWSETLAWVAMPDHVHWLLVLGEKGPLEKLMRSFKSYTARVLNVYLQRKGAQCWQSGYHDHAVRKDENLRQLARYIVTNPLRAGIVDEIGRYPFWDAAWLEG